MKPENHQQNGMNQVLEKLLAVGTAIGLLGGGTLFICNLFFYELFSGIFGGIEIIYALSAILGAVGISCAVILAIHAYLTKKRAKQTEDNQ